MKVEKSNLTKIYVIILIVGLSMGFGYGCCYLINKEKMNYDVNKDGQVDILDLLKLQKHLIEKGKMNDSTRRKKL